MDDDRRAGNVTLHPILSGVFASIANSLIESQMNIRPSWMTAAAPTYLQDANPGGAQVVELCENISAVSD